MNIQAIFGLSILLSFIASGLVAWIFVWPVLKEITRNRALMVLTVPHAFRFIGLSFLVPGVVSPSIPSAFAAPAAYGDLVAAVLAIASVIALYNSNYLALALVWIFNIWGAADFIYAFYQGVMVLASPGELGAAFFIPTVVVPPLFISHLMMSLLLLRPEKVG